MERNHKYVEQKVEWPKTKTDGLKVVVRSKYFKQKQDDKSLKQSIPCLNDCSMISQRKTVNAEINKSSEESDDRALATISRERIYNDQEASVSTVNEVAERRTNIHQIDKEEQSPSVEIISTFSTPENVTPLNSIGTNSFCGAATGKRKLEPDEYLHKVRYYSSITPRTLIVLSLRLSYHYSSHLLTFLTISGKYELQAHAHRRN